MMDCACRHFDDQGNYVEAKDKGEKDAWMASDEAKVVSAEVSMKAMFAELGRTRESRRRAKMSCVQLTIWVRVGLRER